MRTPYFTFMFSEEADLFLSSLSDKTRRKIIFNIDMASRKYDMDLFKKVSANIWEFRTRYASITYRLFAFWDKRNSRNTLVVVTHGISKKSRRLPRKEIEKAEKFRKQYLGIT